MESERYDLVVIGSGPAGEKGAAQAAYFGKKVALIEGKSVLGGTAANTGTLPSKTLRETALFLSGYRNRDLSGLNVTLKHEVTIRDFMHHELAVTAIERLRIYENLMKHRIEFVEGFASFVDPHTVAVACPDGTTRMLQADVFLIAVGSVPHQPPMYHFEDPRIWDSDEILEIQQMPASMMVVGAGVIGCEYACMFAILGIHVTMVEQRGRIIGSLDGEIAEALQSQMSNMGIKFCLNDSVVSVDNGEPLKVQLKSGQVLEPEAILVSSGRDGNIKGLGLEKVGIEYDKRGAIKVNRHYQTTLSHVYAAGDVIGFPALASTSMDQARVAMVHAFDLKYRGDIPQVLPYGIFTIPECSMAGETEESLQEKGIRYVAGHATYANNARGRIIGDDKGLLKLLFRFDDMKLLGVHMIGEQATELIHVGLTALLAGQTCDIFIETCFNYPTLTELYKYAAYDAMGSRAIILRQEAQARADCQPPGS
jgi:NAD(P) transhydrogenase